MQKCVGSDFNVVDIALQALNLREIAAIDTQRAELTGFRHNIDLVVLDVESQRLLGELFEDVEPLGVDGHAAFALGVVNLELGGHCGFKVRTGDFQFVALQLEQKVVEDGHCVLVADDAAYRL